MNTVADTYRAQSERTKASLAEEGVVEYTFHGSTVIGEQSGVEGYCSDCCDGEDGQVEAFYEVTELDMAAPETADDPAQFTWDTGHRHCAECGERIYFDDVDEWAEAAREDAEVARWEAGRDEGRW